MRLDCPRQAIGVGWRAEMEHAIATAEPDFLEVMAEHIRPDEEMPPFLAAWIGERRPIAVHSVSLSLGSAEPAPRQAVAALADAARRCGAQVVSDHIAFTRAGGIDHSHLLPLPRTAAAVDAVVRNVLSVQPQLPVPLALENIASLFEWNDNKMDEAEFVSRIVEETGALLVLDVTNLHANAVNCGSRIGSFLDGIPLDKVAYLHLSGGERRDDGLYHDTHCFPLCADILDVLRQVRDRIPDAPALLEWDDRFPDPAMLACELGKLRRRSGMVRA